MLAPAELPLAPFTKPLHVVPPPRANVKHTTLCYAGAASLLDALSFRQSRLATTVEALLHAQGFTFDTTSRVTDLGEREDVAFAYNAEAEEDDQVSAETIAKRVDCQLDVLAVEEELGRLPDKSDHYCHVYPVGREVFSHIRDGRKTVESRILQGVAALVEVGDLLGFVAEIGDPVLWKPVLRVELHHNHVKAAHAHGDSLWPGASGMDDESLDLAFWRLHDKVFTRDEWVKRFADSTTDQVVCWELGASLPSTRMPSGELYRSFGHAVSQRQQRHTAAEATDKSEVQSRNKETVSTLPAWSRIVHGVIVRFRKAAVRIQRWARGSAGRRLVKLAKTRISAGDVTGPSAPSRPEVARDETPMSQCS